MRGKGIHANELHTAVTSPQYERLEPLSARTRKSVFDESIVARLMVGKYKSTITGIPFLKDVVSCHLYRLLFDKIKPMTIIDLGTAFGGSAAWFAKEMPNSTVVTIDIEDIRKADLPSNVKFIKMDLSAVSDVRTVLHKLPHPWIVSEDCHLPADIIMRTFDGLMQPGDYIVFEDTHPCGPDVTGASAESEVYQSGTWSTEKLNRVETEMLKHTNYVIDSSVQDFYGYNGCTFINSIFVKVPGVQPSYEM